VRFAWTLVPGWAFFDLDHAVGLGEIGRELVQKNLSRIRRPHVQTADLGLLFFPITENLLLRASLRCAFASLSWIALNAFSGLIFVPSLGAANTATPRSSATDAPVRSAGPIDRHLPGYRCGIMLRSVILELRVVLVSAVKRGELHDNMYPKSDLAGSVHCVGSGEHSCVRVVTVT
jgi:hypothetical protein